MKDSQTDTGIMIPTWIDGQLRPYDKLAAHLEGRRHKAVSVFVMSGNDVLLQQRALEKYHTPGLWANTCCTHPKWDENSEVCALRRLREELGISGISVQYRGHVEYRADVGNGLIEHENVDVFLAQTTKPLSLSPNPQEVMATEWMDYDALVKDTAARPGRYTPWLRIYLSEHQDLIFGGRIAS